MGDISIGEAIKNIKISNEVASECGIPELPKSNCEIPMPFVDQSPINNENRICKTCNKEDVCMYKRNFAQAVKEITRISERVNQFIDTDIRCKKWSGKNIDFGQYPLCEIVKMGANPGCGHLINNKYCNDKNILCSYKEK